MAERAEKRKLASLSRTFGVADLPPDIVVRIATKLDLTSDIRNLSSSCSSTRNCLGVEAWSHLISRKFGSFDITYPFPSWFPQYCWSDLTPRQRHLYCMMRAYDYRNSPKLCRTDCKESWRHAEHTGCFVAVAPGTYDIICRVTSSERRLAHTSITLQVLGRPEIRALRTCCYDKGETQLEPDCFPDADSTGVFKFFTNRLTLDAPSNVDVHVVDEKRPMYYGCSDFDFSVKLRKREPLPA